ncbi:MAG TPA: hypothetical protein VL738_40320 [Dactylosporangium sp.]|nr:hypothetical protein [Dactylosporangium sp.]
MGKAMDRLQSLNRSGGWQFLGQRSSTESSAMFFRRNWIKTTGRVLDSRIREWYHNRMRGHVIGMPIAMHNYIVEFTAPNGEPTKLEVEQHIETVDVAIGSEVPLLVSPDAKKAVFDKKDPRINLMAVHKARKEAEKKADEERFRRQLEG